MGQVRTRRFRNRASVRHSTPEPVDPTGTVTENDVVRMEFHDGALTPEPSGSIHVQNEAIPAFARTGLDWKRGAVIHAGARPNPASGSPWHGAPWDWTINGVLVEDYKFINLWWEAMPYATTGLPAGVRVQFRDVNLWTITGASTSLPWVKRLGPGAIEGSQTSSGAPGGGYFRTTPNYEINTSPSGAQTKIGGWPESPAVKRRTEPADKGGGWSITFDPMRDSAGNLLDNYAVGHGPFLNTDSPDRIEIPTGGYFCYWGEARLVMDDYSPVPAGAKFVARLGSDIFRAKTAAEDPPSARSTSSCNPRARILPVSGDWVGLGFCSGSAAMIRDSFPPLPMVNA